MDDKIIHYYEQNLILSTYRAAIICSDTGITRSLTYLSMSRYC